MSNFYVIKAGGRQYKVSLGDEIVVDHISKEVESAVEFDVIASFDGSKIDLTKKKVRATILSHFRAEKVIAFKMRQRHTYKRKKGFRASLVKVKIDSII